jgi:hypothetical protein
VQDDEVAPEAGDTVSQGLPSVVEALTVKDCEALPKMTSDAAEVRPEAGEKPRAGKLVDNAPPHEPAAV